MGALTDHTRIGTPPSAPFLQASVVSLTLITAAIHASLGGLMFTLTALGYAALAVAMILPGPLNRVRWIIRLALVGFTAATIAGWVAFGARFPLAYVDKAVEVALIGFLAMEVWLFDGGPSGIARRTRQVVQGIAGSIATRGAR
jgi:hypothetical protein